MPLRPSVAVELERPDGKLSTAGDGTTVTLAGVDTADPQADVALAGNTGVLKGGVATFIGVVLSDAGTYQLQASDADGDGDATSPAFDVVGDHLAFKRQPAGSDAGSPVPFAVELEDAEDHPVTDESGQLQFTPTPVADTTDTQLAGDADPALADGLYTNQVAPSGDAVAVDYGGTYTLTAADDDAADADTTDAAAMARPAAVTGAVTPPTPATSRPFKIKAPTLKYIDTSIGDENKTTKNNDLAITPGNLFAAVRSTDATMGLEGINLDPETPQIMQKLRWAVVRNAADVATGPDPTVTQSASDPLRATLSLDAEGSFNVICYYDANGNGTFDPGEQIKVANVAIVAVVVTATPDPVVPNSAYFGLNSDDGKSFDIGSGDSLFKNAITASESVQVIGGGPDGMLGVSSVHVGWVQNGTTDGVEYGAADGAIFDERLQHTAFPILDASYHAVDIDKYPAALFSTPPGQFPQAAPGVTRDPATGAGLGGGQDRTVAFCDSPAIGYLDAVKGSPITTASGTLGFDDQLTAYSDGYSSNYIGLARFTWNAAYRFAKTAAGWQNSDSAITASEPEVIPPTTLAALGVRTGPPAYIYSEAVDQQHQL